MSRKWNEPDKNEIKFIKSYLFVVGKSTKKRMEFWWKLSPHWNGEKSTATLHASLMDLRKSGIVLTDNTNRPLGFSLK